MLNTQFIVIEKTSNDDIELFSKQDGINDPKNYSVDYIQSAHGGRTKDENRKINWSADIAKIDTFLNPSDTFQ